MANMNIHTTMGAKPKYQRKDITMIKRYMTALFKYTICSCEKFDSVNQFMLVFKQDDALYTFKMFDYFKLTEDTIAEEGKTYYIKDSTSGKIIVKEYESGATIESGTYEEYKLQDGDVRSELVCQEDEHFTAEENSNGTVEVTFVLSSKETAYFSETDFDDLITAEYILQHNNPDDGVFKGKDSVVIEAQNDIVVIDSVYGSVVGGEKTGVSGSILSNSTSACSESITCLW